MQRSLEQRMTIKFCVKLEKSAAETIPMLKKDFGVDCLSDRQIFRWHKAFAEGREYVNDENRAGRPSTSSSDDNVKRVRDLLNTDRRLSVCLIYETLDITKIIVHEIVSCTKILPLSQNFEIGVRIDTKVRTSLRSTWAVSLDDVTLNSGLSHKGRKDVICISSSESTIIKQKLQRRGFHLIEASGAGYKIMTVILGLADAYLLTKPTTFKWDTCAPHTILKSLGGDIVQFDDILQGARKSITYSLDENNCNKYGIIAYMQEDVLGDIVEALKTNFN
ncbi:hypothetical protein NQ318_005609 [Aromia moschata]|uniref:Mos1 transposase HTH domain-containing protein n=1 Tax=Aromia moschata TaxID=1265417 RepID=A0AAV8XTF7_9CUCU|nr:hypothetical protein NQ318_005609 [Aromia moschata]